MARQKGTLKLGSNIEPNAAAPLDARTVVNNTSDLTLADNFPYAYDGMVVSVRSSHSFYMFKGGDITNIDNWAEIGKDGSLENYYTKGETNELLDEKADAEDVETALADKVDKEVGKGLSTEDYTTVEKQKLNGIASGAEANVQSDWQQDDNTSDDYIKNKPSIYTDTEVNTLLNGKVDKVSGKGLSTEDYTTAEKTKLNNIADGAEVNVQADYSQTDTTADDYIKNKPTLGTASSMDYTNAVTAGSNDLVTSGAVYTAIDNLPEPLVYKGTLASDGTGTISALPIASASNEGWLYLVTYEDIYDSQPAKMGDKFACAYDNANDLYFWQYMKAGDTDTDTWREIKVNGVTKLVSAISSGTVDFVDGDNTNVSFDVNGNKIKIDAVDTTYDPATTSTDGLMSSSDKTKLNGIESGAQVNAVSSVAGKTGAVSLDKSDVGLGNVPNVTTDNQAPTVTEASTRANIATGDTLKTIIGKIKKFFSDLKAVAFSGSYNDLSDKPTIPAAQVNSDWNATSGKAQILNKPTIPTVNNATLTIQKNGTAVETFTANASSNKTANITVPTKVSELTNDSGYTTNTGTVTQVKVGSTAYNPSSGVVSLPAYPTSLPASDVSAWAKASTKPSYNFGEIGAGVATIGDGGNYVQLRSGGGAWNSGFYYQTTGDEAFVFGVKNSRTSFIFANTDPAERTVWTSLSPAMQIKDNKVAINKLIANSAYLTYPLEVNGDVQATNFRGNLVGNADTATKATKDGDGNTISSTYLKKSGGTMTGTLTSRSIEPSSDTLYALGSSSKRFNVGWFRALDSDTVTCGRTGAGGKSTQGILEFYPYNHTNDNRVQFMVDSDATLTTIYTVLIRAKSGTLALTSDIPSQAETTRRSRYTMSTKGAWTTVSYSSNLPSSYGHAIILIYYTTSGIRCLMNEIRVTKAEWADCANPNIMMPFVSSPPNDAYGVYLQYVSTSQFKYYVGSGLAGDWSVTIKTTDV